MSEVFNCVVEIPKGSRNKYEYDPDLGGIKLDRFISASVVYPTDYGYVPETVAPDGDPLDDTLRAWLNAAPRIGTCRNLPEMQRRKSTP